MQKDDMLTGLNINIFSDVFFFYVNISFSYLMWNMRLFEEPKFSVSVHSSLLSVFFSVLSASLWEGRAEGLR